MRCGDHSSSSSSSTNVAAHCFAQTHVHLAFGQPFCGFLPLFDASTFDQSTLRVVCERVARWARCVSRQCNARKRLDSFALFLRWQLILSLRPTAEIRNRTSDEESGDTLNSLVFAFGRSMRFLSLLNVIAGFFFSSLVRGARDR